MNLITGQRHTLIVRAHGALIHLDLQVRVDQVVIRQNSETNAEESCRMIRVKPVGAGESELSSSSPLPFLVHRVSPRRRDSSHPVITGDNLSVYSEGNSRIVSIFESI